MAGQQVPSVSRWVQFGSGASAGSQATEAQLSQRSMAMTSSFTSSAAAILGVGDGPADGLGNRLIVDAQVPGDGSGAHADLA